VPSGMCTATFFLAIACYPDRRLFRRSSRYRLAFFLAMFFRQVGQQHFPTSVGLWESRIIRMPSMISVRLVSSSEQLAMQLVGNRQAEQVRDHRAVERRQQGGRHERTKFEGSVMLANICTMPIKVPTIPNAGVQSPMAR